MRQLLATALAALLLAPSLAFPQHPPNAQKHLDDALLLLSAGKRDDALRHLHLALRIDPRHWPSWLALARLYDLPDPRNTSQALDFYEIFAQNAQPWHPALPDALHHLLDCHERLRDWDGLADAALRLAALHRQRNEPPLARLASRRRAQALLLAHRPDDALQTLHALLFEDPYDPHARRLSAQAHLTLGHPLLALHDLHLLLEHAPQEPLLHRDLGVVLFRLHRYHQAADALQRSLSLDGARPDTLRWLARAHEALGHLDRAEALYRRGLLLGGPDRLLGPLRNDLAWLLALQSGPGDPRLLDALALAQRAVKDSDRQDPALCDTLTEILLRLGRPDLASPWAARALRLAPADPWFQAQQRRAQRALRGSPTLERRPRLSRLPPPRPLPSLTSHDDNTR